MNKSVSVWPYRTERRKVNQTFLSNVCNQFQSTRYSSTQSYLCCFRRVLIPSEQCVTCLLPASTFGGSFLWYSVKFSKLPCEGILVPFYDEKTDPETLNESKDTWDKVVLSTNNKTLCYNIKTVSHWCDPKPHKTIAKPRGNRQVHEPVEYSGYLRSSVSRALMR